MQKRAVNRVTKPTNFRRPNRRIDEDQLAAHFEGTEEENALYRAAAAVASAEGQDVVDTDEAVMEEVGNAFKDEQAQHEVDVDGNGEGDVDVEHETHHHHHHHHQHGGHDVQGDALDHEMPMAPMSAEPHHQQAHHVGHQNLDDILGHASMTYAQAAAAAADLQPPPPPQPNVGGATISAPQPLVAATDFQPTPSTSQHTQSLQPPSLGAHPAGSSATSAQQHQQQEPPQPPPKTTEQMAEESGYAGFKVDSAFAKRMSRDPGQRLAEQRRQGQDLNLVRRSNVEALFAQIAGSEAANPCAHCRKGQGPWTVCVVYSGQMMGSCANCWFNASGSRCSFHEKSQPPLPGAHHPYATLPVAMPVLGQEQGIGVGPGVAGGAGGGGAAGHMVGSPVQLHAAQLWQAPAALFSHDAGVKHTVQNALVQVRQADRYARALIEVEVAAKQLALKIVQAEEVAAGLGVGVGVEGDEEDHGVDEDEDGRHGSGYESPAPGGNGMPEDGEP
ncbi:hypothetical protein INS49_007180 [Diaporthe citri]|uniref:uncharacterized protein n=1 Tax=Diaporthe citri TaxID=83186 RepID=UPI001C7F02E9|nr:uncharacterized protein INS49_007180 [Diaporthe citri]KAG6365569.1 hypothetical protein INS49_007180 [Diaporthe citri]